MLRTLNRLSKLQQILTKNMKKNKFKEVTKILVI